MSHNLRDDYSLYHQRMDKFFSSFPLFACGGAGGAAPCITLASRRRSFIRNLLLARGVGFAKYFPRLQNSRLEGSRGCPSFFFSYCWWVSWTSPSIVPFCSCLNIFLCLGALINRFFLLPDIFLSSWFGNFNDVYNVPRLNTGAIQQYINYTGHTVASLECLLQ